MKGYAVVANTVKTAARMDELCAKLEATLFRGMTRLLARCLC